MIEIISVDFDKNEYKRRSVYSPGEIKDLKIAPNTGKLYTAYTKDKNLGVSIFTNSPGNYNEHTISEIRNNVSDAALAVYDKPEVLYSTFDDTISIGERLLEDKENDTEFKTGFTKDYKISLIAGNILKQVNPGLIGFLSSENKNSIIFLKAADEYLVSEISSPSSSLRIKDKNQLFFGELRFNGPERVTYYNQELHNIKYLKPAEENRKILRNLLVENVNSRSFFIKNMNTRKYHLVYINNEENCITVRELK